MVTLVADGVTGCAGLGCNTEFVGDSSERGVSVTPMSKLSIGAKVKLSPGRPRPVMMLLFGTLVPARLSQKMLLNISGLLNDDAVRGSVCCNWVLLAAVDRPAGAGWPLLVMAVAVVRFFITVLS